MNISPSDFKVASINQNLQDSAKEGSSTEDVKENNKFLKLIRELVNPQSDAANKNTASQMPCIGAEGVAQGQGNSTAENPLISSSPKTLQSESLKKVLSLIESMKPNNKAGVDGKNTKDNVNDEELLQLIQGLMKGLNNLTESNKTDIKDISANPSLTVGDSNKGTKETNDETSLLNVLNSILELMKNKAQTNNDLKQGSLGQGDDIDLLISKLNTILKTDNGITQASGALTQKNSTTDNTMTSNSKAAPDILNSLTESTSLDKQPSDTGADQILLDNLSSIIEAVKANIKQNGKVSSDENIKQVLQELISGIDVNQLKEVTPKDTSVQGENLIAGVGVDTDDLKNKLVEILVILTKDSIKKDNGIKQTTTTQKFTELLSTELKKDNADKKDILPTIAKKETDNTGLSKEDKLLKSVIDKEDVSKTNKVNNFIAQLNNTKEDIQEVQTPDNPIINKATFTQDIVKAIKYMNANDLKELTVKIAPKELGEITIKLTMEDGNMKANISAHSKETYNLLSSNHGELTNSLGNNDIKIHDVNINIYQDDTTFFNGGSGRGKEEGDAKGNGKKGTQKIDGIGADADINEVQQNTTNNDNNISILA